MSMWRKSFCIPIIIDKLLGDINGKISKWSILFAFYYILCKHITYFAEVIKAKVKTHSDILWLIWRYRYKFEQEWTLPMHPVSPSIFSMGSCFSIFSFSVVLCRSYIWMGNWFERGDWNINSSITSLNRHHLSSQILAL